MQKQPPAEAPKPQVRVVRFCDLKPRFGITFSRVHLRRLEAAGRFPIRVPMGRKSVFWIEAELEAWMCERAAARYGPKPPRSPYTGKPRGRPHKTPLLAEGGE